MSKDKDKFVEGTKVQFLGRFVTIEDANPDEAVFSNRGDKFPEVEDYSGGIAFGVKDLAIPTESIYSVELDEVFTQLHDADRQIAETRNNTRRLGIETRLMLEDLRKQIG